MNTPRPHSTYAPPGKGQATQGHPAGPARSNGEGGWSDHQPLKDGNPASSLVGPWVILPLALAAWAGLAAFVWALVCVAGLHG